VGPAWCLDKPTVRLALAALLERRDTWQGKCFEPAHPRTSAAPATTT
jgi:radical SAM superfamily enzyme